MTNILKVTTPIGGYDNGKNVRVNTDLQNPVHVQGPVDTEKVIRPDAASDSVSQQENQKTLQYQYETNFDSFMEQLRNSPILPEKLSILFKEYQALLSERNNRSGYFNEIGQFLSMIEKSPEHIQKFVASQSKSALRFTGAFFGLLRQILNDTKSVELKNSILNFVKKYTDMAENESVFKDILRNLQVIQKRIYPSQREEVSQMIEMLDQNAGEQSIAENLRILKSQILPFLNRYISASHDRGVLRDTTAGLAELIGRYENGIPEGVKSSFDNLMEFHVFQRYFNNFDSNKLFDILNNTEFEKTSKQNKEFERFGDIICRGVQGEGGNENKVMFKEIMNAIILNESVYMPVLHFVLPLSMGGRMLFSELWIDPDVSGQRSGGEKAEKMVRGLVKFDVQDLGFFDLYFLYYGGEVTMQLNIPSALEKQGETIKEKLDGILKSHDLTTKEIVIGSSEVSIPLEEAFPNIRERRNSINVRV